MVTFARSYYCNRRSWSEIAIILVDTVDMFWSICHCLGPMRGNLHTKNYETLSSPMGSRAPSGVGIHSIWHVCVLALNYYLLILRVHCFWRDESHKGSDRTIFAFWRCQQV